MARPIDADAIVFDYSGLAHIGPYDYEGIAKYFADQIARQPTLTQPNDALTPCDMCMFSPPSSGDGKPCCMCPAVSR